MSTVLPNATRSAQKIARERELDVLNHVHKFGYLTHAQISALVYPNASQSLRLAQRTVKRLVDRSMLLRHAGGFSDQDHVGLSAAGARFLASKVGHSVESAKDMLRDPSLHRDAANWAAIWMLREGWPRVWSEREIQTARAPFREMAQKVPDTLAADHEGVATWVEVEASARGGRDMLKLAQWLVHAAFPNASHLISLDPPRDDFWLGRVRFVLAAPEARTFPGRLQRQLERMLGSQFDSHAWDDRVEFQSPAVPGRIHVGFP